MGCFSVQNQRKSKNRSALRSSLLSPQSIIIAELEQGSSFPSPASYNGSSRDFELAGSRVPLSKSSPLHSSSFKLMKNHLKPPSGAVPLTSRPFSNSENLHLAENSAVKRSFSYGHGDKRLVISHSALKSSLVIENEQRTPNANEQGISNANLFPLPLPPTIAVAAALPSTTSTDDASSQSVSSTGSGSSLSSLTPFSSCSASACSVNSKSCHNSSSCSLSTTAESHPLQRVHPPALPLPPPPDSGAKLLEFSYEELAGACLNFAHEFFIREGGAGPVFRAMLKHAPGEEGSIEIAVTRLNRGHEHSFKRWRSEVESLARLSHPHLCKVLGFSGEEPLRPPEKVTGFERERLIVYEHTSNGNLESLLYCRKDKAPLDWVTRVKIAMGAARGLAYLHERIPRQIIYKSFRTINVQVDLNFNAKLSDYGFARRYGELPMSSPAHLLPVDDLYMAPETRIFDELSSKSNVWSFGIVLLELLTGRQHMDDFFPPEERNLLQWCRPYLLDSKRLYLIMDPELKGRYPTRVAKMLADLALHCLAEDPVTRPSMWDVARSLWTHAQACNGADIKTDYASNVGAKNRISHINPANSIGFSNHMNGISCGKPRYDGSAYNNCGSKFKLSKSYSLASVLASPARALGGSACANNENTDMHHAHNHRTRVRGLLSGEAYGSIARDHSFLSSYGFVSGEMGVKDSGFTEMPISQDYYEPPPLGRCTSSSNL